MKKKLAWIFAAAVSLVSNSVARGNYTGNYSKAVDVALNPETTEHVKIFYETLGWPVAGVLAVPTFTFLVAGLIYGEWDRRNFWLLLIPAAILGFVAAIALPLLLLKL